MISNSWQDILLKPENVNPMMALEINSGDNAEDSSCGDNECLYQIPRQYNQKLLRQFSLDQSVRPTNRQSDHAPSSQATTPNAKQEAEFVNVISEHLNLRV